MKTSQAGIDLIKSFEGCRLKVYYDAVGVLTIGYGHTGNIRVGQAITQDQAEELLKKDLKRFEDNVNEVVKVPINQHQFDALVAFSFNVGESALKTSTLCKKLNDKDYIGASKEFGKWVKGTVNNQKVVLNGLVRRRKAEMELFLKPVKKPIGKPTTEQVKKAVSTKKYHAVVKGDTVWDISVKYKTTIDAIERLNPSIENINRIKPGQKIRVK